MLSKSGFAATRRTLLGGALATATMPFIGSGAARAQMLERTGPPEVLVPLAQTDLQGQAGTFYSEMASTGPAGANQAEPLRMMLPGSKEQVLLWMPSGALHARLVIFSHGELGSPELHDKLLRHWTTHGFAVIAPVHQDSIIQNSVKEMAETRALGARSVLTEVDAWKSRVEALSTCLDALPWLQSQLGVRFNDERPIIAGHSFGAFCASLLMGTTAALPSGQTLRLDDRRFFASLMLSPQGRGVFGLQNGSWDTMRSPAMWLTGIGDNDITGQSPTTKIEPWQLSPPGNRHLAWLSAVRPSWMSGAQIRPGDISELVFSDIKASTTAFLRAYGDYDKRVLEGMSSSGMTIPSGGRLNMQYR